MSEFLQKLRRRVWDARYFILAVAAGVALFYGILMLSFWRAGDRVAGRLAEVLGCEVKMEKSSLSPMTLRVDMRDVKMWSPGESSTRGHRPMFEAERVSVWADPLRLLTGRVSLRRVALEKPSLEIRPGANGKLNIAPWLGRAWDCDYDSVADGFPQAIRIVRGAILIRPWKDSKETILIHDISGLTGMGRKGNIGAKITAVVFGSKVELLGGMRPCEPDSLGFKIKSQNFNFTEAFRAAVDMASRGAAPAPDIHLGTGKIEANITGAVDGPVISGRVALRDFDAAFTVSGSVLSVSDLRAGIGEKKLTGSGSLDFSSTDLPYTMDFDLENMDFAGLMSQATGYQFAPSGRLGGRIRITGTLAPEEKHEVQGDVEVVKGALRLPMPGVGPESPGMAILRIPFKSLNSHFKVTDDGLEITDFTLSGEGWEARGDGTVGALPDLSSGFGDGFPYTVRMTITAEDVSSMFDESPGYRGLLFGALEGRLRASGDLSEPGAASAAGYFTISGGAVANPYLGDTSGAPRISFDTLSTSVTVKNHTITIDGGATGGGMEISWRGAVSPHGQLDIKGSGEISSESSNVFAGLAQALSQTPLTMTVVYRAQYEITGTLAEPFIEWGRPAAARWKPRDTGEPQEPQTPSPPEELDLQFDFPQQTPPAEDTRPAVPGGTPDY